MNIQDWADHHLIAEVPHDLPVWHWTHMNVALLRERLEQGDFSEFTEGAIGRGLYVSLSAIDTIDKGSQVVHAVVPAGTRVLMVDPDLFGVGVAEFFAMFVAQRGFSWKPKAGISRMDKANAQPAKVVIPRLMDMLGLSASVYIFGFHLALMIRKPDCLRIDPTIDAVRTVADYVAAHPKEQPTLVPREVVTRWLAEHASHRRR